MQQEKVFKNLLKKLSSNWVPLPDKPDETPEITLKVLWFFASGDPRTIIRVRDEELPVLNEENLELLTELVQKRTSGYPLAYLINRQDFMGIEFFTSHQAMIPRKETEILAKTALDKLTSFSKGKPEEYFQVIDLCTGSGILALVLAKKHHNCKCFGTDISAKAIELAKENAHHLGLEKKVNFFIGDLFSPFLSERFYKSMHLITCNPPYISSNQLKFMPPEIIDHEPHLAFDGGAFGANIFMRVIRQAPQYLKADSWLCFEVGLGQGELISRLLQKKKGFDKVETYHDKSGNIRVVAAHYL